MERLQLEPVGVLHNIPVVKVEWRIAHFSSMTRGQTYESAPFHFSGESWRLQIIRRDTCANRPEIVRVYLLKEASSRGCSVSYSLSWKKADGRLHHIDHCFSFFYRAEGDIRGYFSEVRRDVHRGSDLGPYDDLTIVCNLEKIDLDPFDFRREPTYLRFVENGWGHVTKDVCNWVDVSTQTELECCVDKLCTDFGELLLSGGQSDVTLMVKDEEFRLHRAILAARTPVFEAMFRLNTKEKTTGLVFIRDCEPDVFRAFLRYLYSGKVDHITTDTVFGLFALSEKYQVDELKTVCLDYIKRALSVGTMCETAILAVTYNQEELLELAADYFSANMAEILQTAKWVNFLRDHSEQANQLLLKFGLKHNPKQHCHKKKINNVFS